MLDPGPLLPLAHHPSPLVLGLYLVPVLAVVVAIIFGARRARRFDEEQAEREADRAERGGDGAGRHGLAGR